MSVNTSLGITIAVTISEPATEDEAGYEGLTYTNIGEVVNIGEIGPSAAVVNHDAIDKGYTQKFKGQINYGSMPLQLGRDIEDAGQVILKAGADGAAKYTVHTWKVTHPAGLVQYFRGMIFSYTTNIGGSNSIIGANASVELNTPVLDVAA
jgi:hypothetical protein